MDKNLIKKIVAIVGVIAVIAGIIILAVIKGNDGVDTADRIYEASELTGGIPEKIIGNEKTAKVIVYEYADYGCSHCAEWNKKINELVEKYDGGLAVVFRNFDLGYKNSKAVAMAATAAQLQGYFKEYKDTLFNNQIEWFYLEESLDDVLISYFESVSQSNGDLEKFKTDMKSRGVEKRYNYDNRLGEMVNLKGTPTFRIDGAQIPVDELISEIEKRL